MFTLICEFRFPDGAIAIAAVSLRSPHSEAPVEYSGAADRLPDRFEESDQAVLRVWAERVAANIGAELAITVQGQFDWWAQ